VTLIYNVDVKLTLVFGIAPGFPPLMTDGMGTGFLRGLPSTSNLKLWLYGMDSLTLSGISPLESENNFNKN